MRGSTFTSAFERGCYEKEHFWFLTWWNNTLFKLSFFYCACCLTFTKTLYCCCATTVNRSSVTGSDWCRTHSRVTPVLTQRSLISYQCDQSEQSCSTSQETCPKNRDNLESPLTVSSSILNQKTRLGLSLVSGTPDLPTRPRSILRRGSPEINAPCCWNQD